jgi:hypothetical protein
VNKAGAVVRRRPMSKKAIGFWCLVALATLSGGFLAGKAHARGESKRVHVLKEYGTFKGTLMDYLLYEDKSGYLYAIDPRDGSVKYIVVRTGT